MAVEERALWQYVSILAAQADIVGVNLQGVRTPRATNKMESW
jgi:hypothetical protein